MKPKMKYFFIFALIVVVAIVSLAIVHFETVMGMGIWIRKFIQSGTLDRQDMINHFSSDAGTPISLFPAKTIDGERIGSLFFFQCLANKRDVDKFMEKYKIKKVTNERERKERWGEADKSFKKSRLVLPEYNDGEIFYDMDNRLNIGSLFIYISGTKREDHSVVLVTFFCVRI